MGLQESKPLTESKKISKTKSNLTQDKIINEADILDFTSQLNTLASLDSTNSEKYNYTIFQKLPFNGKYHPLPLCSTISTSSNSIFVCYDCSNDDKGYLCQSCFQKGNHDGHRFSVFPNNHSWNKTFCRCGDEQFMKKNKLCETHKQVKKVPIIPIDQKQKKLFSAYFNQIFRTLFKLQNERKQEILLTSLFAYINKITQNNLYYSKMVCEYLLEKSIDDESYTNIRKFIVGIRIRNSDFFSNFRNLNFVTEYKTELLREIILALNDNPKNITELSQLVFNFAGKIDPLNKLAKDENLIIGIAIPDNIRKNTYNDFYSRLIQSQLNASEIWICIVRENLIKYFIKNSKVMITLIQYFNKNRDSQLIYSLLEQILQLPLSQSIQWISPCLMIIAPDFFLSASTQNQKSLMTKSKSLSKSKSKGQIKEDIGEPQIKNDTKRLQSMFQKFYEKLLSHLIVHNPSQSISQMILLLPFFSFGQSLINKFWSQINRRIHILEGIKERKVVKQASLIYFNFLSQILEIFYSWEHVVIKKAEQFKIKTYIKDKKLIEKLLVESFEKQRKIFRQDLLNTIDKYSQGQRALAADVIKKYLRYNAKKGKYYYVGEKLGNNPINFEKLKIQSPFKQSQWQKFVVNKIFTNKLYEIMPKLISISQRGLMEDIEMVKRVSNVAIGLCILNKSQIKILKNATRQFIKEIPDVSESIYYILADIRDRLELDVDDMEQKGARGKKKVKLDAITQVRDKKFKQMKEKQDKILKSWLSKDFDKQQDKQQEFKQNICHICKEKQSKKNRFVYFCNFTRNNVISTILKSEVTDLDINICLHKVHEQCYQKVKNKRQCPVCKLSINCYIPERPLDDESYSKSWLKNFQNIVTRINLESGKSFNSDWATIFLTYLVYSRCFKVLLNNTEVQTKQRQTVDRILIQHFRNQFEKWPELSKQTTKKAQKTVKGQVSRESNIKKAVKSLALELAIQQITQEPFKSPHEKRILKKVREIINLIGSSNSQKIIDCFEWSQNNQQVTEVFDTNIAQDNQQQHNLFKIRDLPSSAQQYLKQTSIKCPMCNRYEPTTWQCLFCNKISCRNCLSINNHGQRDHRGTCIVLHLNDAKYQLIYQNRSIQTDGLYRNQYSQQWKRNLKPEGWKCCTDELYTFFDNILHSIPVNVKSNYDNQSEDENQIVHSNWGNVRNNFNNNQDEQEEEQIEQQQEQNQDQDQGSDENDQNESE